MNINDIITINGEQHTILGVGTDKYVVKLNKTGRIFPILKSNVYKNETNVVEKFVETKVEEKIEEPIIEKPTKTKKKTSTKKNSKKKD